MRFLFAIDNSYDKNGPTQMLTRRLCIALAQKGHDVDLLDMQAAGGTVSVEIPLVKVHTFNRGDGRQVKDFFSPEELALHKPLSIIKGLARNRRWWRTLYLWKLKKRDLNQFDIQKGIEQLCRDNKYDYVVASCAPHYTAFALLDAKIPYNKAVYMCDPYYLGEYFTKNSHKKQEQKLYETVKIAFVTEFMYEDYTNSVFSSYINKVRPLPLPGIQKNVFKACPATDKSSFIDCVYVGNFYWLIRRPDYLLKLFIEMNSPRLRLKLVVGGPLYNFPEDYFEEAKKLLGERFIMEGPLPYEQAYAAMQNANILINLGNSNANMLPSKIFDYFSFCKPILNIRSIENDPTNGYFAKYPLAHTVSVEDDVNIAAHSARDFCETAGEKPLSFDEVQKIYMENTPEYVAAQLLKSISEIQKD